MSYYLAASQSHMQNKKSYSDALYGKVIAGFIHQSDTGIDPSDQVKFSKAQHDPPRRIEKCRHIFSHSKDNKYESNNTTEPQIKLHLR